MTEEFAIDSTFRNTTAVDSKILLTSAWRMIVDNTRNDFLTHTRFTDDKHRKICRCHLQGDIERTVQSIAITHDVIPLFYFLKFTCVHLADKITHFF